MVFVFLGAPGAGKGTQASRMSKMFEIPHISTGEIFRENIREQTELGKLAQGYIDKGMLCPDNITIELVKDRIQKDDCKNGFILDGFPRTTVQAEFLNQALEESRLTLDAVVNIHVEDENIINRMSGRRVCPNCGATYHVLFNKPKKDNYCDECSSEVLQRADDNEETVRKRLEAYHRQTAPLIDYYEKVDKMIFVDGNIGIDDTSERIISKLKAKVGGTNDLS